jgi:hypothetical protein
LESLNVESHRLDKRRSACDPHLCSDDYAEIWFETQSDANVAVERMNELFKKATQLDLGAGRRRTSRGNSSRRVEVKVLP